MDYKQTADQIKQAVGGSQNIESVAHCATRLRLVLKDDSQANKAEVEKIEGVKGAFTNSGQFQIIIGQGAVNKVYEAFVGGGDIQQATAEEQKKAAAQKLNWFQRFARTLSNIFVPIIPVIVASGVLMGLLGMLSNFGVISPDTGVYKLLDMISNAAFTFLPVLIAYSAAKEFGCNPYLAAILGAIMIHPNLQNAWTMGTAGVETQYLDFFGFQVAAIGYQGQVLPVLIAVLLMAFLEKRIHKIMPNCLDLLLTPFFTLLITAVATFFVIGPVGRLIGDGISIGLQYLYTNLGPVAGLLFVPVQRHRGVPEGKFPPAPGGRVGVETAGLVGVGEKQLHLEGAVGGRVGHGAAVVGQPPGVHGTGGGPGKGLSGGPFDDLPGVGVVPQIEGGIPAVGIARPAL